MYVYVIFIYVPMQAYGGLALDVGESPISTAFNSLIYIYIFMCVCADIHQKNHVNGCVVYSCLLSYGQVTQLCLDFIGEWVA